jgi:hypothetical protein
MIRQHSNSGRTDTLIPRKKENKEIRNAKGIKQKERKIFLLGKGKIISNKKQTLSLREWRQESVGQCSPSRINPVREGLCKHGYENHLNASPWLPAASCNCYF